MAATIGKAAHQRAVDRRVLPKRTGLAAPLPRLEAKALPCSANPKDIRQCHREEILATGLRQTTGTGSPNVYLSGGTAAPDRVFATAGHDRSRQPLDRVGLGRWHHPSLTPAESRGTRDRAASASR